MNNLIAGLLIAGMAAGAAQSARITRVVGRVVDAKTKAPLEDAAVILQPVGSAPQPLLRPLKAQTDDRGIFSLDVPSGRYRIIVNLSGFVRSDTGNPSLNRSISGREVNVGDIRLMLAGALEGRVLDPNGIPLPGVIVSVVPPGLNIRRRNEVGTPVGSSAPTDDRGAFRVAGLPAGRYYVVARPGSRSPFIQQAAAAVAVVSTYYPGAASAGAARLVEVIAGNTTNGIDFQLAETATTTVSGIVVDNRRGWPVEGALVSFQPETDRLGRPFTVTAQADGTFTVAVPDGTYRLEVSRPIVVATANSRSVRYERATKSVKVKVDGRPVSGIKVVADR